MPNIWASGVSVFGCVCEAAVCGCLYICAFFGELYIFSHPEKRKKFYRIAPLLSPHARTGYTGWEERGTVYWRAQGRADAHPYHTPGTHLLIHN